ncbi:MAG TPA: hypothetical protein VN450_05245, partial [Candidatus Methylomirabilis sp.]|nr:hypothetical protein [Candidatus Methylomirabilis sp.]
MTPVPSFPLFARLYRFFSGRRKTLFAATALLIALGGAALRNIEIREDIESMLPDDTSDVARDFRLLQSAPFTRKILITLTGGPRTEPAALLAAADRLARALPSPDIVRVATGPADPGGAFLPSLVRSLPRLVTPGDMTTLEAWSKEGAVGSRLRDSYEKLLSPEGWALKEAIRADPLSFRTLAFEKMGTLNMIPNMRILEGHFVSADRKSALVIADTSVPVTDSMGARRLLDHIAKQTAAVVPPGIKASLVCGHRYALANAEGIRHDLYVILGLASLAVLAV